MSFRYTKVYVEPPPQKFYGFKKVNPEELLEIVNRIQRPTVTTSTQFDVWKNPIKRDCATPMPKQILLFLLCGVGAGYSSYLPPFIYGEPLAARVVAFRPESDYRGYPTFRVVSDVLNENGNIVEAMVHRHYGEFNDLDLKLKQQMHFWDDFPWQLPGEADADIVNLSAYLGAILTNDEIRLSILMEDFLAINWNASDVDWFKDLQSFMNMVNRARVPNFPPEPPIFTSEEDATLPETMFEKYIYLKSFHHDDMGLDLFLDFFRNYTELTPAFDGPEDNSDVWPPGATQPIEYPYHYNLTYVHFLPGGYLNGHTVRIGYCGYSKFNFLMEDILREYIIKEHGFRHPSHILDIGTGNCFSAMVYAELFPDAQVIGVDLAAPYIRFCRLWKEQRGLTNLEFYQDNGESTHFEANTFDIVQYSYVLHEMPMENAHALLTEAHRILKPGGTLSGFEVPYLEEDIMRQIMIETQTWGYHWNNTGPHGPEPYNEEYLARTILPERLIDIGYVNNTETPYCIFDRVYLSHKPWVKL